MKRLAFCIAIAGAIGSATPALAQTSWGVAATAADDLIFCDLRRDRVWRLDREGALSVVLPNTHCRALALASDGFVYGESVSAGTHIDATSGTKRDTALGVWRLGASGTPHWVQPPTLTPNPSVWLAMDVAGHSYGWNGALPRSSVSQIVRRDAAGLSIAVAGAEWGQQDGVGVGARLGRVSGLAFAPDGTLLVADSGNIRRMSTVWQVRTESVGTISDPAGGVIGQPGLWDRTVGLASDADGSALVVDYPAGRIVRVTRDGRATELWRSRGWANRLTGSRWGWRPTGVAALQSGFYVMEDWAMPALVADLVGAPRILLLKPDGSYERVASVSSWFFRVLALLAILIAGSALRTRRRRSV